jgi:epoxyqueuosine reductase
LNDPAAAQRYRAIALEAATVAGATRVAFASARPDERAHAWSRASFARGDFATWPYDDAYARASTDPQTILAGAASIVCIALAFAHPPPDDRPPLTGRISNYAWGADYHAIVRALCDRVARALDEAAGAPVTRVVCDTAPLSERAFAVRAGLGWVGKHTNLIVPGIGSYVFLGEVVTSLDLGESEPSRKSCGNCTRCVDVCPTRALRGDYTIDATRCIADLTQRTDAIPRELRALVGDWVWGCDLCQEICPPTRRAPQSAIEAFRPTRDDAFPALLELLTMRSSTFKRRYRKRALGWRGAAVLRRNAAVGLGNALDRAAVPVLVHALEADPHPLVRGHVAWALGRIGSPAARDALARRRDLEADPAVFEEITAALGA